MLRASFYFILALFALLFDMSAVHVLPDGTRMLAVWVLLLVALGIASRPMVFIAIALALMADAAAGSFIGGFTLALLVGLSIRNVLYKLFVHETIVGRTLVFLGSAVAASIALISISVAVHYTFRIAAVPALGTFAAVHLVTSAMVVLAISIPFRGSRVSL